MNIQWFLFYLQLCNHHHHLLPEHFYHPKKKLYTHWKVTCPSSFLPTRSLAAVQLSSFQLLFVTLWTATHQASLSITNSHSLLKLMSIESVIPSNHRILCRPLLLLPSFQASESCPVSQFFTSGGQSTEASASALVLPVNIQDWFPLGLTGLIHSSSLFCICGFACR